MQKRQNSGKVQGIFISKIKIYNTRTTPMSKSLALTFSLVFFLLVGCSVSAQPFSGSVGVRVGAANGLSLQHFLGYNSCTSGELLLVHRRGGPRAVALVSQFIPLGGRRSDAWLYLGLGGHAGMDGLFFPEEHNVPAAGVDAIAGLLYRIPRSSFAISLDIKPMMELVGGPRFSGDNAGFTVRYTLD